MMVGTNWYAVAVVHAMENNTPNGWIKKKNPLKKRFS
tara:strand:- start:403 stop:513 length:111 start_codon:yes stop_codon:yes gene_type:complete